MIYLSSFKLSNKKLKNPNIYPYSVFKDKYIEPFSFAFFILPERQRLSLFDNRRISYKL